MPSISNLATNADLNAKINEVKGEISGVNTLFKESRLWCKKIRNGKKNTTSNYDKFMTNILDAKIKKKS